MKKFIKTNFVFILICLFFALFNIIFFVASDLQNMNLGGWLGYTFVDLSFIAVAVLSMVFKLKSLNLITALLPMSIASGVYLIASVFANSILILVNSTKAVIPIILNSIILAVFAAVLIVVYKLIPHTEDNSAKIQTRMANLRELSVKTNALTFLTKDDDILTAIRKLKETLNYSSSAGNRSSAPYEEKFVAQLETVEMLLVEHSDKESVLAALETANNLWKVRNQMLMVGNAG